jgi:hypothetical protein
MNYLYIFIDISKQGERSSPWTPPFWETHGSRCHYVASRSVAPPVLSPWTPPMRAQSMSNQRLLHV